MAVRCRGSELSRDSKILSITVEALESYAQILNAYSRVGQKHFARKTKSAPTKKYRLSHIFLLILPVVPLLAHSESRPTVLKWRSRFGEAGHVDPRRYVVEGVLMAVSRAHSNL